MLLCVEEVDNLAQPNALTHLHIILYSLVYNTLRQRLAHCYVQQAIRFMLLMFPNSMLSAMLVFFILCEMLVFLILCEEYVIQTMVSCLLHVEHVSCLWCIISIFDRLVRKHRVWSRGTRTPIDGFAFTFPPLIHAHFTCTT